MLSNLGTFIKWLILLPILAVIALIAVANDHMVALRLNPFDPADSVLQVELALYQVAFLAFLLGALAGAVVVWAGQHRYRRRARQHDNELALWRSRAERNERRAQQTALMAPPNRG